MIHLSSYHSNGMPTVVWPNKVNLIGEKVYKPKIHFCEHCNKPILIYGRLIPCKHVFCFTCATLCLSPQQQQQDTNTATNQTSPSSVSGCHHCGGRALRVERNTLNSIFVCQVDTCRRTYLSARDLQAHVAHRHNRNKSNGINNPGTSNASIAAISSSPYMSSSTLMHLNSNCNQNSSDNNHRQSSSSSSTLNNNNTNNSSHNNSPNVSRHLRRDHRDPHNHYNRDRERERERERDRYHRDRDSKEYHRQSLQRAAQWAEASAQMLEKGLNTNP